MYDYVIIHGSYGSPFENWFPWLFNSLEQRDKKILAPQFPTINQCYKNWESVLKSYDQFIDENTSFIAHSLGPAFVLDYLLTYKKRIRNLYFVAPFYGLINIKEFDDVNKSFFMYSDLSEAKSYFNNAWCFYSDNDPYVPISMAKEITDRLSAKTIIVPNGKHLNSSAGFVEFNDLLKVIEENE